MQGSMLTVVKVCAGCNAAGYALTAALETHKLTDLVGCGSFVASAVALTVKGGGPTLLFKTNPRAMVLNGLVMFWGARLGSYLFQRVLQIGEDKRLDKFFRQPGEGYLDSTKSNFPIRLSFFWTLQSMWGILCMIPVALVNSAPAVPLARGLGFAPLALAACGIAIECVADYQKNSFKSVPGNKDKLCNVGLWKLARFPNYFGEILTWWSIFLSAAPALTVAQIALSAVSPLTITGLLLFVSGVPLLEASYAKKYKDDAAYKSYVASTNKFVPLPFKLF